MHQLLAPADYRRMPWKNGGGHTLEVASDPPGSGVAAFAWRVSVADVDRDGPFSAFPGVDRTLVLLAGNGMRLTGAGEPLELHTAYEPVRLRGRGGPALRAHRRTDARLQPDDPARRRLRRRRRRPRRGLRDRAGARVRLLRRRGRLRVPDRRLSAVRRGRPSTRWSSAGICLPRFRASTCIRHRARRWRSWP